MKNENVVVVKTDILNQNKSIKEGFFKYDDSVKNDIIKNFIIYDRAAAETDFNYKQIVSYIVCIDEGSVFLTQRKKNNNEMRLSNKFSIGIGGHLRLSDMTEDITAWGEREFYEEVFFQSSFQPMPYGFINDNSNEVGKVHLGVVYILNTDGADIKIKSELKSGTWILLSDIHQYQDNLESWSKLLTEDISFLNKYKKKITT